MSTPQAFGTSQELLQDLAQHLLNVPALRSALEQVVPNGPRPKARIYISSPDDVNLADPWPRNYYQIGAKVLCCSPEGVWEGFGSVMRLWAGGENPLKHPTVLLHNINVLGHQLADAILAHAEAKKPLAIQMLTAQDRQELQEGLPF